MRVDAIDVFHVRHPLRAPWKTAYGEDAEIDAVLTRIHSDGHCGWSEASPLSAPTYSPEFAAGVFLLIKDVFAPLTVGREIGSARELNELLSGFKGNPFAKSALETAWWTLEAKIRKQPLHSLLGGRDGEIEVGAVFGLAGSIDELLEKIQGAVDAGFRRAKLKIKPGRDLEIVKTVRRHFPKFTFHVDGNSAYSLKDLPLFKEMDKLGLAMIEQPLFHADLLDHARLQAELATPICLDESCSSVFAARQAIEARSCRFMNLKPGRVGGLQNALDIHDLCREAGIGCWVGGMMESSVGAGICIELATLENIVYPNDIRPSDVKYREEISEKKIELSGPGRMKPSDVPGIPYEPVPERLRARTVASARIEK